MLSSTPSSHAASAADGGNWPRAEPAQLGFAEDLAERLEAGVRSGLLRGLHGVLVARSGRMVLERYWPGVDESWGRPLGTVAFGPDTLHDLRSVTKSVVGLLYGIALERGLVAAPEAPLFAQFPEYPELAGDPGRASITVAHALSMTMGLEWDEQRPYTDPANSEIAMERAPDRHRFALDRPVVAAAGGRWIYSGGAVALVGRLIVKGAGMTLPEFAREALFEPLGIRSFEWAAGADGVASAASGLRLRPRDLLRVGQLVLGRGRWEGRPVVPEGWIDRSLAEATQTGDGLGYGYLWFLGAAPVPAFGGQRRWMAGFGNGGQRLWLMPDADVAATIVCGSYNQPDAWVTPTRIWREIVLANLLRA